jgi:hypothetical protein
MSLHLVLIDREKPVPTDPKVQVLGVEGVRIDDQELLLIGQQEVRKLNSDIVCLQSLVPCEPFINCLVDSLWLVLHDGMSCVGDDAER